MGVLVLAAAVALQILVVTVFLWLAMKTCRVDGSFWALALATGITALVSLIPVIGGFAGFAVLLFLLYSWTDMDNWLQAILIVVLARFFGFLTVLMVMWFAAR